MLGRGEHQARAQLLQRHQRRQRSAGRLLTIRHDEVHVLVPAELVPHVAPALKRLAENLYLSHYGVDIPLRVDVQVGTSWDSATP